MKSARLRARPRSRCRPCQIRHGFRGSRDARPQLCVFRCPQMARTGQQDTAEPACNDAPTILTRRLRTPNRDQAGTPTTPAVTAMPEDHHEPRDRGRRSPAARGRRLWPAEPEARCLRHRPQGRSRCKPETDRIKTGTEIAVSGAEPCPPPRQKPAERQDTPCQGNDPPCPVAAGIRTEPPVAVG